MIKRNSPQMQDIFQDDEVEVSAERRQELVVRGQRLYGKYCGTGGKGICAESFAEYHIWRGEYQVARDLLEFLHDQLSKLQAKPNLDDTENARLLMTIELVTRIQNHLGEDVRLEMVR
jgi:hypothetical protein